ncbi:hypothetical protein EON80_00475 [bacterium]|nr:MAG: hypothetical protein EON80_00475 [bacterium]
MGSLETSIFCVVDIETTGGSASKDKICEIGFVLTSMTEVLHTAETYVDPGIPIPSSVSAIHHIVDADVQGAPRDFPYGIKLPPRDCYVAHHCAFDSSFLPALSKKPWLCTARLARRVFPDLKSYGNQFLRYELKLEVEFTTGSQPHRALPDALVTAALLRRLLENLPSDAPRELNQLIAWSWEPRLLVKCRFGNKHKGKLWSEVPLDYLQWMDEKCATLDVDTRFTVEHYLGKSI